MFKEGDTVKEGDLLYVLDDERYQAVVNQRKADLEAAQAEARRAKRLSSPIAQKLTRHMSPIA